MGLSGLDRIRVASAPLDHVYVRHCIDPGPTGTIAHVPGTGAHLPSWLAGNAARYDVVHRHLGLDRDDGIDPAHWVATLQAFGKPLIVTCYDLPDRDGDDGMGAVIAAAWALVTITPGAAAEIRRRWGREALVLPHPHVVGPAGITMPRPRRRGFVVGIHCDSARPGREDRALIEAAADAVRHLPGARVRVAAPAHTAALGGVSPLLRDLARSGAIELHLRGNGGHADLFDDLAALDVSILPTRFGWHSWWLEACYDLGTVVIAPDRGCHAEQRPCLSYRAGDDASLSNALQAAYRNRYAWRATLADRMAERHALAQSHELLYRSSLRGPRSPAAQASGSRSR